MPLKKRKENGKKGRREGRKEEERGKKESGRGREKEKKEEKEEKREGKEKKGEKKPPGNYTSIKERRGGERKEREGGRSLLCRLRGKSELNKY